MIDNEKIRQDIIDFLGDKMLLKMKEWLETKKTVFPLLIEDGCPISVNLYLGMPLRNHIRKLHPEIDEEMTYDKYEDYIYYMCCDIAKNYKK